MNSGRYTVTVDKAPTVLDYTFAGMPTRPNGPNPIPGTPGPGDPVPEGKNPPGDDPEDGGDPPIDDGGDDDDDGGPEPLDDLVTVAVSAKFNGEPLVGVLVEFENIYTDDLIKSYTDDEGKITFVIGETGDYIVYVHATDKKKSEVVSRFSFTVKPHKTVITDEFKAKGYSLKVAKKGRNLNADVKGADDSTTIVEDVPVDEEDHEVPKTGDEIWIIFLLLIISTFISI